MKTGQFMSEARKTTLEWLKESLSYMWELRVNTKPHYKTAYLIPKIMKVMESLDKGKGLQEIQVQF
jgi:hypothetical protein